MVKKKYSLFSENINDFIILMIPVLLLMTILFLIFFLLVIPGLEQKFLNTKRENCKNFVKLALSDLKSREDEVNKQLIDKKVAQIRAVKRLREYRYGKDSKNYFWIIGSDGRILMHPYRTDLERVDPAKVALMKNEKLLVYLFTNMQEIARRSDGGFIEYFWSWKDDPGRFGKKQSYVKLFKPWNWVVGTGVYLDDVKKELSYIKNNVLLIGILLVVVSGIFVFFLSLMNSGAKKREKEALNKLILNESKFRSIFDFSPIGIAINKLDTGKYLSVNSAFLKITQLSRQKIMDMTWEDTGIFPGFSDGNSPEKIIQKDSVESMELNYKATDISRNLLYSAVIINYDNEPAVLSMIIDITLQKKMEEELRQSQKLEVVGQLAGGIAHDFNNMLTGILGGAEILAMKLDDESPLQKSVGLILKGARRASDLTRKLLGFSRNNEVHFSHFNVHNVLDEAIEMLEPSIDKNIILKKDWLSEFSTVYGDKSMLQNVFLNLGLNSRDSMPEGGVLSFRTADVYLDDSFCKKYGYLYSCGGFIEIDVSDSGTGMSDETLQKIYDPFFTTKPEGKGTGLGLSMVYRTVRDHSGIISVYSEVGTGTVFKIYLPSEKGIEGEKCTEDTVAYGKGMVLIIDDEEVVRTNTMTFLENLGYNAESASDGYEGIDIFSKEPDKFDLIILDLIMPGLNGIETCRKMKEYNPDIRILFSSGFNREISYKEIIECGGCGFIQKPYQFIPFSKAVAEALCYENNE